MTKFVKCIDNVHVNEKLTKGKVYEVVGEDISHYIIDADNKIKGAFHKSRFEEVKQEETKFRFIPKTEITEVIVDGIEGVLIKE